MVKYIINGKSLWSYLKQKGYSESKAKVIYWRINNKCMTPEQALSFERIKAQEDQHKRILRVHRKFLGYSDDELDISTKEAKEKGRQKRIKKLYHGKTLSEWAKESGLSTGCLWYRVNKMSIGINEAVKKGKRKTVTFQGKTPSQWFGRGKCSFVYDRINKGWSIDDAFTIPKDSDYKNKSFEQRGYKPKLRIFGN